MWWAWSVMVGESWGRQACGWHQGSRMVWGSSWIPAHLRTVRSMVSMMSMASIQAGAPGWNTPLVPWGGLLPTDSMSCPHRLVVGPWVVCWGANSRSTAVSSWLMASWSAVAVVLLILVSVLEVEVVVVGVPGELGVWASVWVCVEDGLVVW